VRGFYCIMIRDRYVHHGGGFKGIL